MMLRALTSFCLSMSLLLTGVGAAVASGVAPAVDRLVICSGHATVVIYVDEDGIPTSAPHLCPDCAMHILAGIPADGAKLSHMPPVHAAVPVWPTDWIARESSAATRARGPPLIV